MVKELEICLCMWDIANLLSSAVSELSELERNYRGRGWGGGYKLGRIYRNFEMETQVIYVGQRET